MLLFYRATIESVIRYGITTWYILYIVPSAMSYNIYIGHDECDKAPDFDWLNCLIR